MREKHELFEKGKRLMETWCFLNGVDAPKIQECEGEPEFAVCAYYRDGLIKIWIDSCAAVGRQGRAWSYPGYSVDRTPYGVIAHELGHHVDKAHGYRPGINSRQLLSEAAEEPVSGYIGTPPHVPDPNEIFAEHFRLFVTNPSYLNLIRPRTFIALFKKWNKLAETRRWDAVLAEEHQRNAAFNKIKSAEKKFQDQIPLSDLFAKL